MRRSSFAVGLASLLVAFAPARAHAVPFLLSPAYESQLETWLGQGDLTFSILFEKDLGNPLADSGADFHAVADGQGPTFTLLEALYEGQTYVIGGYNPQNWSSINNYNITAADAARTAFIYNLTTGVKQTQRLNADPYDSFYGEYQTHNDVTQGPTFGGGYDIFIAGSLVGGSAYQYSYGSGSPCGYGGTNIVGAAYWTTPCETLTGLSQSFTDVGALEVYTFAPAAAVPEPASLTLLGTGLTALVVRARRRRARPQ